jgi:hypothetical protein
MKTARSIKTAIRLPLIGLAAAWLLFMIAAYSQLLVQRTVYLDDGTSVYPDPRFQLEIYLFFFGITAFALAALAGQKLALRIRTESDSGLAISAHRLNNLGVVLSLVAGAIFAVASFFGAWGSNLRTIQSDCGC